jgi:hypothetical protein
LAEISRVACLLFAYYFTPYCNFGLGFGFSPKVFPFSSKLCIPTTHFVAIPSYSPTTSFALVSVMFANLFVVSNYYIP